MKRPRTIAGIAERTQRGTQAFDPAVLEFVDAWQTMSHNERSAAVAAEPAPLGGVKDAYLAAVAEYLSARDSSLPPAWTEEPRRFLKEPYFAGALESLKAILIAESPAAFRRRLIFVSADALSRPQRALAD